MLYQATGSSQTKLFLVKLRDIYTHTYFDASHDRIERTSFSSSKYEFDLVEDRIAKMQQNCHINENYDVYYIKSL